MIEIPSESLFRHRMPVQLRFNDVDVLGHVNNTIYLSFYDMGKAHYFSELQSRPMRWDNVDRIIANINCSYIEPILFGDEIDVLTRCTAIHNKSFTMQQMLVDRKTGHVKSVCDTVMVYFDPKTHETLPVPDELRREYSRFEGREL